MQSWLGYINRNHDMHLFCVLSFKLRTYKNECFKILNNKRGIFVFRLSTNKCYNDWFKSIEQNLNVLFKYKPKRNVGLFNPEWHTFIWIAKTLLKKSNNVHFFAPMSLILLSKPLESKFLINKINLELSLLTHLFYEKIQDSNINSTKLGDFTIIKNNAII